MDGKKSGSLQNGNGEKPWTEEEVKKLMEMRRNNKKYSLIAKVLKRTQNSCKQKHIRLNGNGNGHKNGHNGNGKRTKWTPEQVRYLKHSMTNGKTAEEISKFLKNKSTNAVIRKYRRLQDTGKKWTDKEKLNLARMETMGLSIPEIATILNKKPHSVSNEIKSLMESNEWEKLVKEVIEEDKVNEDSDDDLLQLLEDVSTPKKDTNVKLKL